MEDFRKSGGSWSVQMRADRITGGANVFISTPAQQFGKTKYGRRVTASLVAACQSNRTGLYLETDTFLSNDAISVTYRVGDKPAQTSSWQASTDFQAAFAPGAVGMLKTLTTVDEFRVRLTPYGESPMDFTFVVTSLDMHLPKLRKACHW